jgi:hypothetical protein
MANRRAFIAFDYDHDEFLRTALVGQSKHPDTDFDIADWSVKEPFAERDWEKKVRTRIKQVNLVIVICGEHTHTATGVATELRIAREERQPYFLLWGYSGKTCYKPTTALDTDKIYKWEWDILKKLVRGER